MRATTSGARPNLPAPNASPESFNSTRREPSAGGPEAATCPSTREEDLGRDISGGVTRWSFLAGAVRQLGAVLQFVGVALGRTVAPAVARATVKYLDQAPTRKRANPMSLPPDRKSTRLNSSHVAISYAVFCLKK